MKNFIEILIKRKIGNAMFFLALSFLGILSLKEIPIELMPNIEIPKLTVITNLPNAAPEQVEKIITTKVEEALGSVQGVSEINSESIEGMSIVKVKFSWGMNMDMALIEAKEKVDLIRGQLPEDTGKSLVIKYDPAEEPVMILVINETEEPDSGITLRQKAEKEIVPQLERIEGIAAVDILGGEKREIRIEVDNNRLFARKISLTEICDSIKAANYSYPAGNLIKGNLEYNVRTVGEFNHVSSINSVVVARGERGTPIYLGDVAKVRDGLKEKKAIMRFNGKEGVSLLLRREPGKNIVATCKRVDELLRGKFYGQEQKKNYEITKVHDQSEFIKNSVKNVFLAALLSGVISFAVLLFFFRTLRPSLIIATSLPVSITGTFILMYFFGITINTISLGGLALGIGMMVDSGIVVIESIKSREMELSTIQAAIEGTLEVLAPVTASILTTIIVFLPIIFLKGLAGALFKEMAMTVSISLIISLLTSILLIPMLYTIGGKDQGSQSQKNEREPLAKWRSLYIFIITTALKKKRRVLYLGILAFLTGATLFLPIRQEIMPEVIRNNFFIEVTMPGGTKLEDSARFVSQMEEFLKDFKEIKYFHSKIGCDREENISEMISGRGADYALVEVFLRDEAASSMKTLIKRIKKDFKHDLGIRLKFFTKEDLISAAMSLKKEELEIQISGNDEILIEEMTEQVAEKIRAMNFFGRVESLTEKSSPEIKLTMDREKAAFLGIDMESLGSTVAMAVKGLVVSSYRDRDEEIDIRVNLAKENRRNEQDLMNINIKSASGEVFPISKIAEHKISKSPVKIIRKECNRIGKIYLRGKLKAKNAEKKIRQFLDNFPTPQGYEVKIMDGKEELKDALKQLGYAFLLALIFIYMLLASQFQSLVNPLIVMLSIPITGLGVSLALILTGQSININSSMGMILLAGVVVNNAIVLFDVIENERNASGNLDSAIVKAGTKRLRPILLTTFTTVFSLLPLALGLGQGSELQRPLAVTVMGGLLVSTFLTLVIIPVTYSLINGRKS